MNSFIKVFYLISVLALIGLFACDESSGPDKNGGNGVIDIGGETELDLTKPGNEFKVIIEKGSPEFEKIKRSIKITSNNQGIVTTEGIAEISVEDFMTLKSKYMPDIISDNEIFDYATKRGITFDTNSTEGFKVGHDLKLKITSEGIQDFYLSKGDLSKPNTLVKYSSKVGDVYAFTCDEGIYRERRVVHKSSVPDWETNMGKLKTIRVEENLKDFLIAEKVTFVFNEEYGLVGGILLLLDGEEIIINLFPPDWLGAGDRPKSDAVIIGNQTWMTRNLDVSHYRNGDKIPQVQDPQEWDKLTTGAWCYLHNDPKNVELYGKLYNFWAVNDPRGLAPVGWRVPSDDDWKELEMYLGMSQEEADKQGERGTTEGAKLAGGKDLWDGWGPDLISEHPDFNKSGFYGFPAGFRANGHFFGEGYDAQWWSYYKDEFTGNNWPTYRGLEYESTKIYTSGYQRNYGLSVRLIREE
ncbi:MAG: fibrobacter succinogenes major paralogous domain-containing protein [Candidatus Kapabacteria bacterium]|nr:fibrobacter succinogenes major paralogous domain-containing protein [Candidatus Kapabacteria bacterium]